jgi:putative hydrolase of the HAD superfamily
VLKAVFFDAAGTLFDTRVPVGSSYARLARRYGVDADDIVVSSAFRRVFGAAPALAFGPGKSASELRLLEREWWRQRVAETFAGLGQFDDFEAYFDALFAFFANPTTWAVAVEAPRLLEELKELGLKLGIISNFDARLYDILSELGLAGYFDSVTISSEAGFAKPNPEIFRTAMTKHSVAAEDVLHVGDSIPLDVGGANAAGIPVVLVEQGRDRAADEEKRRLDGLKIKASVGSLAELVEIVTAELS